MPAPAHRPGARRARRQPARRGLSEGVCNHFSLAAPGRPGLFLTNPQGAHWSELRPSDVVTVDVKGRVAEGRHNV